jgi:hydroxymethylbilane synthase
MTHVRLATRQSPLALWQANYVKQLLLHYHPALHIELVGMTTAGDKRTDVELTQLGGKSLFVKELQTALLENTADIAVHSIKDMSVNPCPGLTLAAVCQREDARDAFVSSQFDSWQDLPAGAVVGTTSPRRQCQLLALRADVHVKTLRGNVGTRLGKLDQGEFDAILLACAGLKRLGLSERITQYLHPAEFVPAIGQGALGIECRADDRVTQQWLAKLNDWETQCCVTAERAVNFRLGGDCYTPIGAHAQIHTGELHLHAIIGAIDGTKLLSAKLSGNIADAEKIGIAVAEMLLAQGAAALNQTPSPFEGEGE